MCLPGSQIATESVVRLSMTTQSLVSTVGQSAQEMARRSAVSSGWWNTLFGKH